MRCAYRFVYIILLLVIEKGEILFDSLLLGSLVPVNFLWCPPIGILFVPEATNSLVTLVSSSGLSIGFRRRPPLCSLLTGTLVFILTWFLARVGLPEGSDVDIINCLLSIGGTFIFSISRWEVLIGKFSSGRSRQGDLVGSVFRGKSYELLGFISLDGHFRCLCAITWLGTASWSFFMITNYSHCIMLIRLLIMKKVDDFVR